MRLRSAIAFFGVILAFAGCSLLTDLSGFSDGADPADSAGGAPEGSDAMESSLADAGADVSAIVDRRLGCGASDAGLVAYWPIDEGQGRAITDCSGNGVDGTLVGDVSWIAGHDGGKALQFAGDGGSYIDIASSPLLAFTGTFSLAAWVYFEPNNDSVVIGKGAGATNRGWVLDDENTNVLNFFVATTPSAQTVVTATVVPSSRWIHVASVYSAGKSMSIYLDGKVAAFVDMAPASIRNADVPVRLGERSDRCCSMVGRIDEVRVYKRELTADEIAVLAAE